MVIVLPLVYLFLPWIILFLLSTLKRQFTNSMSSGNRQRINNQIKPTVSQTLKKHMKFTIKEDKRGANRIIFFALYLIGLVMCILGGLFDLFILLIPALLMEIASFIESYATAKKIISERARVKERMLSLKSERMGLVGEKGQAANPDQEFEIQAWEEYIQPCKVFIHLPTRFDSLEKENFLQSFNLIFGGNRNWVADESDPEKPGWDFIKGECRLILNPPLPKRADWDEEYIFNPAIAPGFFPMALGSENGVKITNSKTGKEEFVLGIDFNGTQTKLAGKMGTQIGPEITSAPQLLIAGGTGGGKALAVDTLVPVLIDIK